MGERGRFTIPGPAPGPDVEEQAIEHEVTMLAADLELRLTDALEVVRSYAAERGLDGDVDAAATGEGSDLGPGLHTAAPLAAAPRSHAPQGAPASGVLATVSRH